MKPSLRSNQSCWERTASGLLCEARGGGSGTPDFGERGGERVARSGTGESGSLLLLITSSSALPLTGEAGEALLLLLVRRGALSQREERDFCGVGAVAAFMLLDGGASVWRLARGEIRFAIVGAKCGAGSPFRASLLEIAWLMWVVSAFACFVGARGGAITSSRKTSCGRSKQPSLSSRPSSSSHTNTMPIACQGCVPLARLPLYHSFTSVAPQTAHAATRTRGVLFLPRHISLISLMFARPAAPG